MQFGRAVLEAPKSSRVAEMATLCRCSEHRFRLMLADDLGTIPDVLWSTKEHLDGPCAYRLNEAAVVLRLSDTAC